MLIDLYIAKMEPFLSKEQIDSKRWLGWCCRDAISEEEIKVLQVERIIQSLLLGGFLEIIHTRRDQMRNFSGENAYNPEDNGSPKHMASRRDVSDVTNETVVLRDTVKIQPDLSSTDDFIKLLADDMKTSGSGWSAPKYSWHSEYLHQAIHIILLPDYYFSDLQTDQYIDTMEVGENDGDGQDHAKMADENTSEKDDDEEVDNDEEIDQSNEQTVDTFVARLQCREPNFIASMIESLAAMPTLLDIPKKDLNLEARRTWNVFGMTPTAWFLMFDDSNDPITRGDSRALELQNHNRATYTDKFFTEHEKKRNNNNA